MKEHFGCPIQATSNVFSGKWKVFILWHLSFGSLRFAQLRALLPGISEKVLTTQLRQLEHDGLIHRVDSHTASPRVDYSLSDQGDTLIPILEAMCAWGMQNLGIIPSYRMRTAEMSSGGGEQLAHL